MIDDDSKVIVIRAWRDGGRMLIRVLAGTGEPNSAQEWVFTDIDAVLARIAEVLGTARGKTKC
ncbi:hypothetical protein AB0H49_33210 [Nocardia sp. NPDC050713]|uniref:hypothetical protein n=1 Tax=Nocardia sp. NPDC050713 TaxID=3154511 RepID=UPI003405A017